MKRGWADRRLVREGLATLAPITTDCAWAESPSSRKCGARLGSPQLFTFILRSLVPQVNHAAKNGLNVYICRLCNHSSVLLRRKLHTRDVFARKRDRPTLARRTLLSPSFPVFQKESRESPLLSRDGEMIDRVVEWFETKELLRCLLWPAIQIPSRLFEEIVTVFDSSPRSSPKGHPRLPLDVPDVFQSVSVKETNECIKP